MVIDGMHYSPDCNCKTCRETRERMPINKKPMETPKAKLGDVVVVNLHGTITQEKIITAEYSNKWNYNRSIRRGRDGLWHDSFKDENIIQNLTTNKTYE